MTATTCVLLFLAAGALALLADEAGGVDTPASSPAPKMALSAPAEAEFKSDLDGTMQKYMILLPAGFDPARTHDVMLAFHGHGSDRHQYATDPRGECAAARDAAAGRDMIFIAPDYRPTTSWMGPSAEADVVQLIGELRKKFKAGKVFLNGGSMGGTAALTFAALHKDLVDGVCSLNATANLLEYDASAHGISEAIKTSFGGHADETPAQYKERNPDEYRKRSAEFHPEQFTMPLAIVVCDNDGLVPPASAIRLARSVQEHNRHVCLMERHSGHATTYEDALAAMEFVIAAAAQAK